MKIHKKTAILSFNAFLTSLLVSGLSFDLLLNNSRQGELASLVNFGINMPMAIIILFAGVVADQTSKIRLSVIALILLFFWLFIKSCFLGDNVNVISFFCYTTVSAFIVVLRSSIPNEFFKGKKTIKFISKYINLATSIGIMFGPILILSGKLISSIICILVNFYTIVSYSLISKYWKRRQLRKTKRKQVFYSFFFASREFVIMIFVLLLIYSLISLTQSFLPFFLKNDLGVSDLSISIVYFLLAMGSIIGSVLCIYISLNEPNYFLILLMGFGLLVFGVLIGNYNFLCASLLLAAILSGYLLGIIYSKMQIIFVSSLRSKVVAVVIFLQYLCYSLFPILVDIMSIFWEEKRKLKIGLIMLFFSSFLFLVLNSIKNLKIIKNSFFRSTID